MYVNCSILNISREFLLADVVFFSFTVSSLFHSLYFWWENGNNLLLRSTMYYLQLNTKRG